MNQGFSSEHYQKLLLSSLKDGDMKLLRWRSLLDGRLEIDYLKPDGAMEKCHDNRDFKRWRLSQQEIEDARRDGKKIGKYRSLKDEGCRVYHSHIAIAAGGYSDRLQDPFVPLRITEGELKTESAAVHDPKCVNIGLGGVSSWRDRYDGGEDSKPLVDWDEIPLKGREVRLCFDSDLRKPQVLAALQALSEWLTGHDVDPKN